MEHRRIMWRQLYLHRQSVSKLPANFNRLHTKSHTLLEHAAAKASRCWSGPSLPRAHPGSAPSAPSHPAFPRVQHKAKQVPLASSRPGCCDSFSHHPVLPHPSSLHPPARSCLFHDASSIVEQERSVLHDCGAGSVKGPCFPAEGSEHSRGYVCFGHYNSPPRGGRARGRSPCS